MSIGFSYSSKTSSLLSPGGSLTVLCQGLEDFGWSQFGGQISQKRASYAGSRRTLGGSKRTSFISCSCRNPFFGSSDYHLFATLKRGLRTRVQVAADYSDSKSDSLKYQGELGYHPLEALNDYENEEKGELKLKDAEIARTILEVNHKATIMLSNTTDVELQDSIFWPEVEYVTDEHGDIYLEVDNDEDVLQSLSMSSIPVIVFIGLDDLRHFNGLETTMHGINNEYDIKVISDSDTEIEDDFDEDWISFLEEESHFSESLGDWANLETMRSVHPIYFSRKMAEVVSTNDLEKMDRPLQGLAIMGRIRPALMEEEAQVRKFLSDEKSDDEELEESIVDKDSDSELEIMESLTDGTVWANGPGNDEDYEMESSVYKLEIINIQLLSHYGNQCLVSLQDFHQAEPDILAHSASTIIARINSAGKKTKKALKSLCRRIKGIQVEEATLVGVDSLGIDVRACSGIELQTLRFAFNCQATSEFTAEQQLRQKLIFAMIS
ncbi:hypothetical protein SUGI_0978930 [Cryptomeria japonica]|nr:hypothetical protein SUGI_0978930 [Cryptomeria japonica]